MHLDHPRWTEAQRIAVAKTLRRALDTYGDALPRPEASLSDNLEAMLAWTRGTTSIFALFDRRGLARWSLMLTGPTEPAPEMPDAFFRALAPFCTPVRPAPRTSVTYPLGPFS